MGLSEWIPREMRQANEARHKREREMARMGLIEWLLKDHADDPIPEEKKSWLRKQLEK